MLQLYRSEGSPLADRIEEELQDMVAAYRVVFLGAPSDAQLESVPAFRDGDRVICGKKNLEQHLKVLRKRIEAWSRFQSDTCYIDDDGEVC